MRLVIDERDGVEGPAPSAPISLRGRFAAIYARLSDALDLDIAGRLFWIALALGIGINVLAAILGTAAWVFWLGQHGWRF